MDNGSSKSHEASTKKGDFEELGDMVRYIDKKVKRCEDDNNRFILSGCLLSFLQTICLAQELHLTSTSESLLPRQLILWGIAILFDLMAVSLGLYMKRRIQKAIVNIPQSDFLHESLQARIFRTDELRESNLFETSRAIPFLFQLSLSFFAVGLGYRAILSLLGVVHLNVSLPVIFTMISITVATDLLKGIPPRAAVNALSTVALKTATGAARSISAYILYQPHAAPEGDALDDTESDVLEQEAAATPSEILRSLIALDSILLDDKVVSTIMHPILLDTNGSPAHNIYFALRIIGNRMGGLRSAKGLIGIVDLREISQTAWEAAVNIAALTLEDHLHLFEDGQTPSPNHPWVATAVSILFSNSSRPLTPKGCEVVRTLTSTPYIKSTYRHLVSRTQSFAEVWSAVRRVLKAHDLPLHMHLVQHALVARFCQPLCTHAFADTTTHHRSIRRHMKDVIESLTDVIAYHSSSMRTATWHPDAKQGFAMLITCAMNAVNQADEERASQAILNLLTSEGQLIVENAPPVIVVALLQFFSQCTLLERIFAETDIAGRPPILLSMTCTLEVYTSGKLDYEPSCPQVDIMRLCRRPFWMLESTVATSYRNWSAWSKLWHTLSAAIAKWTLCGSEARHDSHGTSRHAGHCLASISALSKQPPPGWDALGLSIPSSLIEALHMSLIPDAFRGACPRFREKLPGESAGSRPKPFSDATIDHMTKHGLYTVHGNSDIYVHTPIEGPPLHLAETILHFAY